MEDVIIGRHTRTVEHIFTLQANSQPVIDYSKRRTKLIIYPPVSGKLYLSIANPATNNNGIQLVSTSQPIIMSIETHGDMVTKQWYGFASAGGITFTWYEGILEREK
jgi:hypothetical protein